MKKKYRSAHIKGKLKVYQYLYKNHQLRNHHPYTCSFTRKNLLNTLSTYASLYIKPDYGQQGKNIYKVTKETDGFRIQHFKHKKKIREGSSLYHYLQTHTSQKMIIQKGIKLEKVNGKPYDIRAMVQRKPKGKWVCTGIFAKVGAPNKIVTNYSQGGRLSAMSKIFKQKGLTLSKQKQRFKEMGKLALKVARALSQRRSGMHQMGIDLAYDHSGKLWVLEVNSYWPAFYPLKNLDPVMYKRMLSFARSYGRYS